MKHYFNFQLSVYRLSKGVLAEAIVRGYALKVTGAYWFRPSV